MATLPPVSEDIRQEVIETNPPATSKVERQRLESAMRSTEDYQDFLGMQATPQGRGKLRLEAEDRSRNMRGRGKRVSAPTGEIIRSSYTPTASVQIDPEVLAVGLKRTPRDVENDYIMKSAIFDAYLNGKSISQAAIDTHQEAQKSPAEDIARSKATQMQIQDRSELVQMANDVDLNRPEEAVYTELESLNGLVEETYQDPDIDFAAIGLSVSPEVGTEIQKRLSVNAKVARMQSEILENMDLGDWTRNILGIFVPGKQLKDNYDLAESVFTGSEWAGNFVDNWQGLSPEEQESYLPVVKDMFLEAMPEMRAAQLLGALTKPNPEEAMSEFNALWALWDIAEVSTISIKLLSSIYKIQKNSRLISVMAKNGNKEEASELIATAIANGSDEALEVIGMDTASAANTASKLNTEALEPMSIDGLSIDIEKRLKKYQETAKQLVDEVESEELLLKEGFLTSTERQVVDEDLVSRLQSKKDVDNVELVESTDLKTIIEYDVVDSDGVVIGRETESFDVNLDDAGFWKIDKVGLMSSLTNSPTVWSRFGDFQGEVKRAERLDNISAKLFNILTKLHRDAMSSILGPSDKVSFKGLLPKTREKVARIDKILLQGDEDQVVYTVDQLKSGSLAGGIALQDDEVEAYYKIRELTDAFKQLRDLTKRREYSLRGLKSLSIGDGEEVIAKPMTRPIDATNSINETGHTYFYNSSTDALERLDSIDIEDLYADGSVLSRLPDPKQFGGTDTEVFYVLSRSEDVRELPLDLTPYRTGYIPKINPQAAYFVKQFTKRSIDGKSVSAQDTRAATKTIRVFDNKPDAERFSLEQEMAARAAGQSPDEITFRALGDREMEQFRSISGSEDTFGLGGGGLFTGARSEDDLLFGLDGLAQPRVDAFTALSRNIANLSRYVPRNEWRLGLERKAINTANALVANSNRRFTNFDELATAPLDQDAGIIIRNLHKQIGDWMNIPNTSEIMFRYNIQKLIDSSIGRKLSKVGAGNALHNLKNVDPVGAARAAAFHGMLGWFNPVQLWVQAQGVAVSLSMSLFKSGQFTAVIRDQFALQALQHAPQSLPHIAKALRLTEDELVELKRAWDRSGLFDGVLTTADHASAARGHGIAMDALKRTADKGLMMYRPGELFNRRVAFTTAYQEWKAASEGVGLTDDSLRDILDRTNNLLLNMGKANRAAWQKGLLSLPTQFMQVNSKTLETLLGINGNFTRAERGKILTGQVALYGAAGIPLGNVLAQEVAEQLGYRTQEEIETKMPPELRKFINEGFVGFTTLAMFGADLDISDRSALLGGIDDFVDQLLFDEGTFFESISGAFGTQGGRFWSAMLGTWEPLSLGLAENRAVDITRSVANPFLASITSFRNIDKAIFMHNYNRLVDKSGKNVLRSRDFSPVEEMATAIGFRLSDETEVYKVESLNRIQKEYRKATVNQIVTIMRQAAVYYNDSDGVPMPEEMKRNVEQSIALLIQQFESPYQRNLVRQGVKDKLKDSSSREGRVWKEFRLNFGGGSVDTLNDMRSMFTGPGIPQEGGFEEQE